MFDGKYLDWNQKRIKGIIDHYGYEFMQGKKILDLGCGHADIGGALYRLGGVVTALDVRQEHLKIAAKKFPGIKTVKADLDGKWPFPGAQFDLILDLDILCHLNDYESHIKEICKSTNHLVLETAVCDSDDPYKVFFFAEGKTTYDMAANGQGCRPSVAAIERVLKECGFTFKRQDSSKFNSGNFKYDWRPTNGSGHDANQRRIWFATKTHHANVTVSQEHELFKNIPANRLPSVIKPIINPKLANPISIVNSKPSDIKTALCISGHLRTFLDNYKSVKDHILDKLKCDVFIHTWDTLGMPYRPLDSGVSVMETKKLLETINQLYSPKKIVIEKSRHFAISPIMQQRLMDHRDISGILSMFYKVEACNSLKSAYEEENGFKYDCVVRFRGDLWVEQQIPMDERTNLDHVFLPMYGNFGGACDQFAFGSSAMMDKYCSVYSNIEKLLYGGAIMNPEKLLLAHLESQKAPIAKVHFKYVIKRSNGLIQDNMLLERAIGFRR